MSDSASTILETLRGRILRGLRSGTLESGGRLPSARELVVEFGIDHRPILSAYRQLAREGLVEVRERGGVYVAADTAPGWKLPPTLPVSWFVETFSEAYAREVPATELLDWLRRSLETVRIHTVVAAPREDQAAAIAQELRDDFGLESNILSPSDWLPGAAPFTALKRADLVVATTSAAAAVKPLAERLGKPYLEIEVRPDLVAGEWAMLLRQPLWALVATAEFGDMLRLLLANVKGIENLNILVHGRDDLTVIPVGAPTYVTHRVREALGDTVINGRILPAARAISAQTARQLFEFIVRANLRATQAMHGREE